MKCLICSSPNLNVLSFREMMFGFRDSFRYAECESCGCIQIQNVPQNISKYYPATYYSFDSRDLDSSFIRFIKRIRDRWSISGHCFLGRILSHYYPHAPLLALQKLKLKKTSKILDIGCGSGKFLHSLSRIGFSFLVGIDPFIDPKNEMSTPHLIISKKTLFDMGSDIFFDVIIMNHSFEHMENPQKVMAHIKNILSPGGVLIIRIPVADSWAARFYAENWVQIDAPRHFFLHTRKSISILAQENGFKIDSIVYDSSSFQFWGSEQYKKDIHLTAENSYAVHPSTSIFSKKDINVFKRRANQLNNTEAGDQAIFYLSPLV